MKQARTLMVQGTASTVGKSTIVAGLCRLFAQEGLRVAPFKAQNMALNSWVTRDGLEMGRAQVVQAEAAGVEPAAAMNPVLLKPEGDVRSQVIVMGRPLGTMEAQEYYHNRALILPIVQQALDTLLDEYDLVIIEGAGSPVELNLAHYDMVNMRIAHLAHAPVLLVGDIDRGGIFASLLGTLMLLPPEDRALVKGLLVNKFRGDIALWRDGERLLAEKSGVPVLGSIPFFQNIHIAEEDSVPLEEGTATVLRSLPEVPKARLEIAIIRLPYLSNYDEFDALAADPRVHLRFVSMPHELTNPDLIILPGTKNTLKDLQWLWQRGLVAQIRLWARQGCAVLGICGGYQMLGEHVIDTLGVEAEAGTVEAGLNLLPVETTFAALEDKVTRRCRAVIEPAAMHGLFAHLSGSPFDAYQIHLGQTQISSPAANQKYTSLFHTDVTGPDGWINTDGWIAGCYLHGFFENDNFRQGVIAALWERHTTEQIAAEPVIFDRQSEYDKLADVLRSSIDIEQIKQILNTSVE